MEGIVGKRIQYNPSIGYDVGKREEALVIDKVTEQKEHFKQAKKQTQGFATRYVSDGNHSETRYLIMDDEGATQLIDPVSIKKIIL